MGDHDPSGMNMIQDIRDRFRDFGCDATLEHTCSDNGSDKTVQPSTKSCQKIRSSLKGIHQKFGRISWELDALNPDMLSELISSNIKHRLDEDEYQRVIDREDEEKLELVRVSEAI